MNAPGPESIDDLNPPAGGSDFNLVQLIERLDDGASIATASHLPSGLPPWPGPCLLLVLEGDGGEAEVLPVGLGAAVLELLRERAPGLPLGPTNRAVAEDEEVDSGEELAATLRELIEQTEGEPPDERAAVLMDWVMERLDASRCALLPVEGGVPGAPLVFHHRGRPHGSGSARQVPRHVVRHVARTRESLVAHDVGDESNVLPASESVVAQRVQSYMALPVTFRGRLIAVAYLDRLDRPKRFRSGDLAVFELFAYELARPLLQLLHEQERREYDELRDFLATGSGRTPRPVPVSEALQPVLERARKVARFADESLLILGETGAGKEWLARFVHELSGRKGAFVAVNVSALSEELFAAELMGSVRGAFTGAIDRAGRIDEAEGGTLFLDEIGDLDQSNQVKLLRFLQDRRVRRVGGKDERDADVRVIAATNAPRSRLRDDGGLREDLLQRFGPPLEMPPLRLRREEILALAENWIAAKARQRGVRAPSLDAAAQRFLKSHAWPGNVRQLQLVLSHALALCSGDTLTAELLESLVEERTAAALGGPVASWPEYQEERAARERSWLEAALDGAGGKVEVAARSVGCPASTFRDLMRRNGVRRS